MNSAPGRQSRSAAPITAAGTEPVSRSISAHRYTSFQILSLPRQFESNVAISLWHIYTGVRGLTAAHFRVLPAAAVRDVSGATEPEYLPDPIGSHIDHRTKATQPRSRNYVDWQQHMYTATGEIERWRGQRVGRSSSLDTASRFEGALDRISSLRDQLNSVRTFLVSGLEAGVSGRWDELARSVVVRYAVTTFVTASWDLGDVGGRTSPGRMTPREPTQAARPGGGEANGSPGLPPHTPARRW
jgi:hypothetical protein